MKQMPYFLELGIILEGKGLDEANINRFEGKKFIRLRVGINGIIYHIKMQIFSLLIEQVLVDV
jgi:hypothetical protein